MQVYRYFRWLCCFLYRGRVWRQQDVLKRRYIYQTTRSTSHDYLRVRLKYHFESYIFKDCYLPMNVWVATHWRNDTDREKPKYLDKKQCQRHFVHDKSHMDWPGIFLLLEFLLLSLFSVLVALYLLYHAQHTNIHAPGGIRTRNPSKRAAADPRLRPLGHWDRHRTRASPVRGWKLSAWVIARPGDSFVCVCVCVCARACAGPCHSDKWVPVTVTNGPLSPRHGASSGCGWMNSLQIWRVAANILKKASRTADKGWSFSLGWARR